MVFCLKQWKIATAQRVTDYYGFGSTASSFSGRVKYVPHLKNVIAQNPIGFSIHPATLGKSLHLRLRLQHSAMREW